MLVIVAIILQIVLGLISLAIALIQIPLWLILLIAVVLIDVFNGAPATTHDVLQAIGTIIQTVWTGISSIQF